MWRLSKTWKHHIATAGKVWAELLAALGSAHPGRWPLGEVLSFPFLSLFPLFYYPPPPSNFYWYSWCLSLATDPDTSDNSSQRKLQTHCREHKVWGEVEHHTRTKMVKNEIFQLGEDGDVISLCLIRGKVIYRNPKLLSLSDYTVPAFLQTWPAHVTVAAAWSGCTKEVHKSVKLSNCNQTSNKDFLP